MIRSGFTVPNGFSAPESLTCMHGRARVYTHTHTHTPKAMGKAPTTCAYGLFFLFLVAQVSCSKPQVALEYLPVVGSAVNPAVLHKQPSPPTLLQYVF